MKKILALILATGLLVISFSGCNHADTSLPNGESSEQNQSTEPNPASDFKYTVDSEKKEIRIHKYLGTSKEVVIPSEIENMPVVAIEGIPSESDSDKYEGVFYNTGVVTVVIPETVRMIGFASFGECTELTQITFLQESGLQSIARAAFSGCVKLESIDFSATELKRIDAYAFNGCSALREIQFPDTLKQIAEGAFYECSSLLEVKIPPNVTELGAYAFAYCTSLERIRIPPNLDLNFFDGSALYNVPALKQIVLEEGREEITGYALVQTSGNVEVIVPKGVKKISHLPFLFYSPSEVTISFLGDAPEIVEDDEPAWLEGAVVFYHPETSGWETFPWKDKVEMKPI